MANERISLGPGAEFDLIRRFLPHAPRFGRPDVLVGPGDDCAVIEGPEIAVSTDMSVEDVHFRRGWLSSHEIGYRATAAALSDLAGVGAKPIGVLCSLAVHEDEVDEVAIDLMDGIRDAAGVVDAVVLGGDLTRSPGPIIIDVTVLGNASVRVLRNGARPGDELWVTGELGAAAVVVARLSRGERVDPGAFERFARPVPRVGPARWLAERGICSSMIDLSDGLAGDAGHLAAASRVAILIERERLPIHRAARRETADDADALSFVLAGGEDYELLFTAAPGVMGKSAEEFVEAHGVAVSRIGRVGEGAGLRWTEGEGPVPLDGGGFQHFRRPE